MHSSDAELARREAKMEEAGPGVSSGPHRAPTQSEHRKRHAMGHPDEIDSIRAVMKALALSRADELILASGLFPPSRIAPCTLDIVLERAALTITGRCCTGPCPSLLYVGRAWVRISPARDEHGAAKEQVQACA